MVPVQIFTKSGYLHDGLENWLEGWQKRGWRTRDDREVSNKNQWQELKQLKMRFPLSVISISSANPLCKLEEAKELAREFEN